LELPDIGLSADLNRAIALLTCSDVVVSASHVAVTPRADTGRRGSRSPQARNDHVITCVVMLKVKCFKSWYILLSYCVDWGLQDFTHIVQEESARMPQNIELDHFEG
jgi:hypothetical protein